MAPHAEQISRESVGEMTGALPVRRVTSYGKVPVHAVDTRYGDGAVKKLGRRTDSVDST